jgi:hypothetical protein
MRTTQVTTITKEHSTVEARSMNDGALQDEPDTCSQQPRHYSNAPGCSSCILTTCSHALVDYIRCASHTCRTPNHRALPSPTGASSQYVRNSGNGLAEWKGPCGRAHNTKSFCSTWRRYGGEESATTTRRLLRWRQEGGYERAVTRWKLRRRREASDERTAPAATRGRLRRRREGGDLGLVASKR